MKYELAQQLKDAGFPQGGTGRKGYSELHWQKPHIKSYQRDQPLDDELEAELIYFPTLSELIEACGRVSIKLWINNVGNKKESAVQMPDQGLDDVVWHPTSEEAVANLYLALNPIV